MAAVAISTRFTCHLGDEAPRLRLTHVCVVCADAPVQLVLQQDDMSSGVPPSVLSEPIRGSSDSPSVFDPLPAEALDGVSSALRTKFMCVRACVFTMRELRIRNEGAAYSQ